MKNHKRKAEDLPYSNATEEEFRTTKKTKLLDDFIKDSSVGNFTKKIIESDGNCLFRAILYCLFQNDKEHMQLRNDVCNFLAKPTHKAQYKEGYNKEFPEEERKTDFNSMSMEYINSDQ